MVGEDYVRDELAERRDHAVAGIDTPERAEDVRTTDLALCERGVLRVVLDDQDPNGGRHILRCALPGVASIHRRRPGGAGTPRLHIYMRRPRHPPASTSPYFGPRRPLKKRITRPGTLDERL